MNFFHSIFFCCSHSIFWTRKFFRDPRNQINQNFRQRKIREKKREEKRRRRLFSIFSSRSKRGYFLLVPSFFNHSGKKKSLKIYSKGFIFVWKKVIWGSSFFLTFVWRRLLLWNGEKANLCFKMKLINCGSFLMRQIWPFETKKVSKRETSLSKCGLI